MDELRKRLSSYKTEFMGKENYLVSAVLIPLLKLNNDYEVLFEVRSMELDRQPGEICFPGGKVESAELENPGAAALREATEELGLQSDDIDVFGPLDYLVTPMGAVVYPYVGHIINLEHIVPSQGEVARVFTVPLSFLLEYSPVVSRVDVATRYNEDFPLHRVPKQYRDGWQKRWSFPTYIYEYKEFFIWGMTAIILHEFLTVLRSIYYTE